MITPGASLFWARNLFPASLEANAIGSSASTVERNIIVVDDRDTCVLRRVHNCYFFHSLFTIVVSFMGTVESCGFSSGKWWKNTAPPTGTHLIEYKEKETRTKKLVGKEATELSPEKYGAAEWWLQLSCCLRQWSRVERIASLLSAIVCLICAKSRRHELGCSVYARFEVLTGGHSAMYDVAQSLLMWE